MYLKAIEIRGFKSFADKTELVFKKGVTAVVGPNGSGKSNISDAIKWVLGEQSVKSLRGGKMEDVIFAGTQFRKPVGLAQVVLTLDNSDEMLPIDYNEVTISRRLYRSGESEYFINNTKCRLKDVQEMFMDTGVGKEGYSIIGQGKIEAVLSGKPEERRGLLEEAAGIVKFKARKEEAEKRLKNTEENLIRINDILGTYEERLGPLKIDSDKAKEFLQLSEDLKVREVSLIVNSVDNLKQRISEIENKIQISSLDINNILNEKESAKAEQKKYSDDLNMLEMNQENQKKEYYLIKEDYQKVETDNTLMIEKIKTSKESITTANLEIDELQNRMETQAKEKNRVLDELKKNNENFTNTKMSIEKLEKELLVFEETNSKDEVSLKENKEKLMDTIGLVSDTKNHINLIKRDLDNHDAAIYQIKASCEGFQNSIIINANTKNMLLNEINSINIKTQEFEKKISINKNAMQLLHRTLNSDENKVRSLNSEFNKVDANINMLVSLENQYEGYNKSVKNLMSKIDKGFVPYATGKCFVLGEIINVDKKFETAIEIALGGSISNLITDTEEIAKKLIQYLKENNLGRTTFLPLNILKNRPLNISEEVTKIEGFIGIASDLIQFDKKFMPAVQHVLMRTVIADNMDSALKIAKKAGYSFKIVTLNGDVINTGGSLTGGSTFNKALNVIGRKREIEEQKIKLEKVKEEIHKLNEINKNNSEKIKALDDENLTLKDMIHSENIEITKLQGRIDSITLDNEKLNKNVSVSKEEINLIDNKFKNASKLLLENEDKLQRLKTTEMELEKNISKLENKLYENASEISKLKKELTNMMIEKAKLEETVLSNQRELNLFNRSIEDIDRRNVIIKQQIYENNKNIEVVNSKITDNKEKLINLQQKLSDMDKIFEENSAGKIKIKDKIAALSSLIEERELVLNKREEENHKLQLNLTKYETENESLLQKLNEEYNYTYAEAIEYKYEDFDTNLFKKEIDEIKGKISKLGSINVGAIEEYKSVNEKFTFMSGQRDDLINAKEEIIEVINEMLYKMKTVFAENFETIRENFNETFQELFKGGSADLILEGEDILSAQIEINVQPPGKKLQNINLMSGGEKGLSAIALLFAILKMKPTPFCILDEIEAALDDANVSRYGQFLNKFSNQSQFIVITHRKGTMEASDVLYGVTMEEKGVSKIVSVDLAN